MVIVNNKILNYHCISGEMEHEASFTNKTGSNAVATHSDTTRIIPGGLAFFIIFCIPHIPLRNDLNRSDC